MEASRATSRAAFELIVSLEKQIYDEIAQYEIDAMSPKKMTTQQIKD